MSDPHDYVVEVFGYFFFFLDGFPAARVQFSDGTDSVVFVGNVFVSDRDRVVEGLDVPRIVPDSLPLP
ncbi:MAG: hypothetical protein EOP32_27830 [Rhodococcus sp. (in: high G+C Gram-positive bacteria)]|nr:MAG: hypothetical protein EOP32_27830 [Rhodococcus sp. (in: high G+C Gram-positive bacteria)]